MQASPVWFVTRLNKTLLYQRGVPGQLSVLLLDTFSWCCTFTEPIHGMSWVLAQGGQGTQGVPLSSWANTPYHFSLHSGNNRLHIDTMFQSSSSSQVIQTFDSIPRKVPGGIVMSACIHCDGRHRLVTVYLFPGAMERLEGDCDSVNHNLSPG